MSAGLVIEGLQAIEPAPSVVSIGFFDGVHRGHQSIIRRAVHSARAQALRSVVVTFDRHPMEVVNPGSQPKLLMTLARRARTLAEQDVDLVVVLPFDDDVRHWSADAFIDNVLVGPLQARQVVVGSNFRFGHKAAGDLTTLRELGPERGFTAEGVALLEVDGAVVSSTEVRSAVDAGEVELAARMLGRPHLVDGVVVRGDQRGAGLGYPTANVQVSRRVAVPARGIYAGAFHAPDGHEHPCVTSVGVNPTFGGQQLRIEAHLLDFSGDLYGDLAAIDFRHRLRTEERFDTVEALVRQIGADVAEARRLLGRLE
ncbi:MAG: bifunctional riboflavin kinase/FAD synthetase [Actinomycetota bacterium]|nr:bifunctional riboflavin kinase/FAD synthetase [Actinomycetota bacterium]